MKVFVAATGTDAGKTWLGVALAEALTARGRRVAALKPVETGCDPEPRDAVALGTACGRPDFANAPGFHRGRLPRAPYASTLAGEAEPPTTVELALACVNAARDADDVLVEGAGGLLVPLNATDDFADLARALGYPVVLVAPNRLGTLSHVLTAVTAARVRGLDVVAVALTETTPDPDPAAADYEAILAARLALPVIAFPHSEKASAASLERLLHALDS